jgi:hypothetical protein
MSEDKGKLYKKLPDYFEQLTEEAKKAILTEAKLKPDEGKLFHLCSAFDEDGDYECPSFLTSLAPILDEAKREIWKAIEICDEAENNEYGVSDIKKAFKKWFGDSKR